MVFFCEKESKDSVIFGQEVYSQFGSHDPSEHVTVLVMGECSASVHGVR